VVYILGLVHCIKTFFSFYSTYDHLGYPWVLATTGFVMWIFINFQPLVIMVLTFLHLRFPLFSSVIFLQFSYDPSDSLSTKLKSLVDRLPLFRLSTATY